MAYESDLSSRASADPKWMTTVKHSLRTGGTFAEGNIQFFEQHLPEYYKAAQEVTAYIEQVAARLSVIPTHYELPVDGNRHALFSIVHDLLHMDLGHR